MLTSPPAPLRGRGEQWFGEFFTSFYFSKGILPIFFFGLVWLLGCKNQIDEVTPPTELEVTVQDEQGNHRDSISVWLFDDFSAYQKSAGTDTANGFIQVQKTDATGSVRFSNLNPKTSYWVMVSYTDATRFLTFKNAGRDYELSNLLKKSSITSVTITAYPTDGILSFWTASANQGALNVSVVLNQTVEGNLNQSLSTAPTLPYQTGSLSLSKPAGTYKWFAKGQNDCLWQGTIKMEAGKFYPIELTSCDNGSVTFYTSSDNADYLPLTVVINNTDTLGTLSQSSTLPTSCGQMGTVSASRPAGGNIYYAYSSKGTCVWTGSFTITKGACTIVPLVKCLNP